MRLTLVHARLMTLELVRLPAFVVPTLAFPALFFLLFASPLRGPAAAYALCSFAGFAVIGVAFFQFGVGLASERGTPWELYVRTLPLSPWVRLAARLASAAVFAAAAAVAVVATGLVATRVSLPPLRWLELAAVLAGGMLPFGCLGVALGYWTTARGALPLANILYLALSYAGGLWTRPARLPHVVETISPYLPTRHLANALADVAAGAPWSPRDWSVLALYTVLFALLAVAGYRRDEGERFR